MTKKDFKAYIKSFKRKKGTYTDDEIYEISLKHKQLNLVDRNWNELVNELGLDKTGEQLRNWVKNRQREDGTLPKNKRELNDRTIEDLDYPGFEEEVAKQKRDLYIQQTKTRDERNAYKAILRDSARFEELIDCFTRSASESKLPKVKYEGKKPTCDNEAVLLFSDLHIGVNCNNFYNTYNSDIAKKRVDKIVEDTIKYCKRNNVKRLNFLNLGDCIHGAIHNNARIQQKENVVDQVLIASEIIANALNRLQAAAPEVIYRSVIDNHSRLTPNREDSIPEENFNRLIDKYVEAKLANSNVKFAYDNLDIGIGKFTLLNGENMVFSHGHNDRYSTIIQDYSQATREYIDYVCVGHLHNTKVKSFQSSKLFINGSVCGTEEYAFGKRLFGKAEQSLLIFEGKDLINIIFNLQEVK